MGRLALAVAFATALVHAQSITAVVVDRNGQPLPGVRVDHDGNRAQAMEKPNTPEVMDELYAALPR